jgi:hypothetical protein
MQLFAGQISFRDLVKYRIRDTKNRSLEKRYVSYSNDRGELWSHYNKLEKRNFFFGRNKFMIEYRIVLLRN